VKAVLLPRYGGPEVLEYVTDHPKPVLGPDEVLVHVHAVALNHLDLFVREGIPTLKLTLPHILGADVAGEVAELGSDVTGFEAGDRVVVNPGISCGRCEYCIAGEEPECAEYKILGEHLPGGYAEYVAVPAANLLPIPVDLPWTTAAAAPLVFMTAWRLLITKAKIRPGEDVLILGAGSGVSTASAVGGISSSARVTISELAGSSGTGARERARRRYSSARWGGIQSREARYR